MIRSSVLVFASLALLAGCREQGGTFNNKPDTGTVPTSCNTTADCGGRGICMAGVCEAVTSCSIDDQCTSEGKVCHKTRFYCVECDGMRPNECGAGKVCQVDFTCVSIGGSGDGGTVDAGMCSGSCTDRSMCGTDNVCTNNMCCPPPSRCISPADCPASRPECNGATGQCFGGDSCIRDDDCANKPGCANGACFCDPATTSCRMRPDQCQSDMDCYNAGVYDNKYCTLTSPPKRCLAAPACTTNTMCSSLGLICDSTMGSPSYHHCINGRPCPMGNECNPTTEACERGVCAPKTCLNTPGLCMANETCNPSTGMCDPNASGPCTIDNDCPADRYCNTFMSPATCTIGCRDVAGSCPGGQVCDANHQCVGGMGMVCGDCMTDAECPAGTTCNIFLMKCYERCDTAMPMCVINVGATCNMFGYCSCLGM